MEGGGNEDVRCGGDLAFDGGRGSRAFRHRGGPRPEGTAELLPRPGRLDRVRVRPGQRRLGRRRPTPVTSTPSPRVCASCHRRSQVVNYGCPGESSVTFTKGGCPCASRRREAARSVSRCTAQGGAVVPAGSPRTGQPDNPDAVGQRPGSVVGQRQGRAQGDRVVRFAPRLDPRAASVSRTDRRDHRDRSLEPGGRSGSRRPSRSTARSTRPSHEPRPLRERGSRRCTPVFNPPGNVRRVCALSYICARAIRIRMTPGTGPWRTPSSPRPATAIAAERLSWCARRGR